MNFQLNEYNLIVAFFLKYLAVNTLKKIKALECLKYIFLIFLLNRYLK